MSRRPAGTDEVLAIPRDPGAERALLASICLDNATLAEASQLGIEPSDFDVSLHQRIYHQVLKLAARGEPIDIVTLMGAMQQAGLLQSEVDRVQLMKLCDGQHRGANAGAYASRVKECSRRRAIMKHADALVRAASNGTSGEDLDGQIVELIKIGQTRGSTFELEPLKFSGHEETAPPIAFVNGVGETVLISGDLVVFAGDSGAGKSISILDLGISRAMAGEWLGFRSAVSAGRVLIVTCDGDGADPIRARVRRLGRGRGLTHEDLDSLPLRVVPADGFNLDAPSCLGALEQMVGAFDPDLIGLETLSSLMGPERNPNDASDVQDFIGRRLRPLQIRPGGGRRTLILSGHLRKRAAMPGANALRDRVAGSFRIVAGADSVLGFEPAGERAFNVRLVKPSRWGVRFSAFHVEIEGEPPEPLTLRSTGPLEQSPSERTADEARFLDALSALAGASLDGWSLLADVKRRAGVDLSDKRMSKRFERAGKRLIEARVIEAHGKRRGCYRPIQKVGALPLEEDPE